MTQVCATNTWRIDPSRFARSGFTLIEIMVALGILGTALIVLLNAHYAALHLCSDAQEEVIVRTLTERALAQGEIEVGAVQEKFATAQIVSGTARVGSIVKPISQ